MNYKSFDLSSKIKESENELGLKINNNGIIKIRPSLIANWEYRDRRESEIGNIEHLSNSIRVNGQAQPIIITKISDTFKPKEQKNNEKYIVIAGYRRWLACKSMDIDIECIEKNISINEAIGILLAENEKENVSDYSKGILYGNLIKDEKITQNELSIRLGINKNKLSNYIAFKDFPLNLVDAISDINNISARTAGYIRSMLKKGNKYLEALIKHAEVISSGAGERVLEKLIKSELEGKKHKTSTIVDSLVCNDKKLNIFLNGTIKISKSVLNDTDYKNFIIEVKSIFQKYYENKEPSLPDTIVEKI